MSGTIYMFKYCHFIIAILSNFLTIGGFHCRSINSKSLQYSRTPHSILLMLLFGYAGSVMSIME